MDIDRTQLTVRPAREGDYEAVVAFTQNTWPDRDGLDYIPGAYHDWITGDADRKRTVVAESGDDIAGICQTIMLSSYEAWSQGMRVNPAFRGQGISHALNDALFAWAREQGATVCRNMVFSWNTAGLAGSRGGGFDPITEFRWAHPEPDAAATPELRVETDPDTAWSYWTSSAARDHLSGLALDLEESWALSELTREDLHRAADGVFAVVDDGMRGVSYRVRTHERETEEGETERWAEYGVGAWDDLPAARSLFAAISADAARAGADRTRVLIPETPQFVSDAAWLRAESSDEPDFVLEADLGKR